MKHWIAPLSAALLALLLVGCNKSQEPAAAAPGKPPVASRAATPEIVAAETQGFNVGSTMSARVVYVFFDAQCPHCAALWAAARPLKSQARFVWIPVGILNAASTSQGATILAAADPIAAMDEHEASMTARKGGITAAANVDKQKEIVGKNTQVLNSFGVGSIPTVVAKHAQTGAVVVLEGSMPTAVLAERLGLTGP